MPWRMAPRLAWQLIDGEAIVIDLGKGRTLGLNRAGSLIWSLLADNDEDALAGALTDRFDVAPDTARNDVRGFLAALGGLGLVVEAG